MTMTSPSVPPLLPLQVHPEGHYLQTSDGRPFFWLGDTAWSLAQNCSREEAAYYLATRAHQGFNIVQMVALAENASVRKPNALGQLAFEDEDPRRPREAFFDHVVNLVDLAASLGLRVALVPTWGDKLTAPWGTGPRIFHSSDPGAAQAYGRYLGQRLRGRSHIVWMIGGDRPVRLRGLDNDFLQGLAASAGFTPEQDWQPLWEAMVLGLAEGLGERPLCIYHPQGGEFSSSEQLPHAGWLDIHAMQSGHGGGHDVPVWRSIARDAALVPPKPTLDIEPNYEDHPYNPWPSWDPATGWFRDHDVRKQCYRSVFAGACGVTYGHQAVWQFASLRNGVINFADRDWTDALHRPGARQMLLLRRLMESRPAFTRIHDPGLAAQQHDTPGANRIVATRDREGTYALVYFPAQDLAARIDLSALRSTRVAAWWYDPRTGARLPLGLFQAVGGQVFTSPPYGPDWVLMLEDPACGYPAPVGAAGWTTP